MLESYSFSMIEAEIDMSNQINNSWSKNTVLAIGQGKLRYSVMIDVNSKSLIKNFVDDNCKFEKKYKRDKNIEKKRKKYTNRCVSLCHAYLLHLVLYNNKEVITNARVCRDSVAKFLHNYLQNITQHKKTGINKISVKFGLEKNNSVQKYAKEVMQGNLKPDYILNARNVQEIIELIKKFVPSAQNLK